MRRRAVAALIIACAAVACTGGQLNQANEVRADEHETLLNYLATPQYGGPIRLRGIVTWGFETSSIDICDNAAGPCQRHHNIDGSEQNCWLELAPSAARDLPPGQLDGNYLIELTGRVATQPGMFGHLSQYTCQIEGLRIHLLRETGLGLSGETLGPDLVLRSGTEPRRAPAP
jgi:hypothetical protein